MFFEKDINIGLWSGATGSVTRISCRTARTGSGTPTISAISGA
jgi:hypothetical protein